METEKERERGGGERIRGGRKRKRERLKKSNTTSYNVDECAVVINKDLIRLTRKPE